MAPWVQICSQHEKHIPTPLNSQFAKGNLRVSGVSKLLPTASATQTTILRTPDLFQWKSRTLGPSKDSDQKKRSLLCRTNQSSVQSFLDPPSPCPSSSERVYHFLFQVLPFSAQHNENRKKMFYCEKTGLMKCTFFLIVCPLNKVFHVFEAVVLHL